MADRLPRIPGPAGGCDELISIGLVRRFYARLHEPKELVEIDGALADLLEDFSCTKQ